MSESSSQDIGVLVEAFFGYLQRRHKAPATVLRWRPELRRFVEWARDRNLAEITAKDLEFGFLAAWDEDFRRRNMREPAANSVRAVIQAVSSFYNFLERFDVLVDREGARLRNPARALEAPQVRPAAELDWLRQEEDEALRGVPMTMREQIIVFFLRMTGLRLAEALSLMQRDVDLDANTIHVRSSKSEAGFRPVPIPPELRVYIDHWLEHTKEHGLHAAELPFFVTRNRTPMKPQYVEMVVDRVGQRAGLARKLKPHTLRRTFGSYLINRGVRLEVVSRLLGHASTAITEKAYARLEDSTIRREMLRALNA